MADHSKQTIDGGIPTPAFLNQSEQTLFAEAALGEEATRFLESDLGRLMTGYAAERIEAAKNELLTADYNTEVGKKQIRDAQFKAAVASQFLCFVQEAVTVGETAYQQLKQDREFA